jgi:hypothetical protein
MAGWQPIARAEAHAPGGAPAARDRLDGELALWRRPPAGGEHRRRGQRRAGIEHRPSIAVGVIVELDIEGVLPAGHRPFQPREGLGQRHQSGLAHPVEGQRSARVANAGDRSVGDLHRDDVGVAATGTQRQQQRDRGQASHGVTAAGR